jgi:DNA polymerase I-like protein with 3'-5' exonuclease and polymerase domains
MTATVKEEPMKVVVLDTEHSTKAFRPWETGFYMACCGVVVEEEGTRSEELIWFDHKDVEATVNGISIVQQYVDDADLLVFHNAKHDISILRGFGIRFADTRLHCTMLTDYLIEGQNKQLRYKLNDIAERYELGSKHDEVKSYWDRGIDTYDIPEWLLGPYCLQDCHLTMDIYLKQLPRFEGKQLEKVVLLQNEATYAWTDMEDNGLYINQEVAHEIIKEHQALADSYRSKVLEGVPEGDKINLSSSQQLSALLYGGLLKVKWKEWVVQELKVRPESYYKERELKKETQFEGLGFKPDKRKKKDNGYYSTNKDTIRTLTAKTNKQRILKTLLVKYSKHAKVVSTLQGRKGTKGLLAKIQPDGCVHPSLNQTVAATGRLTSSKPNGQNLFPTVKVCFEPRLDGIMQVDLSQIEWRDAAWLSQDQVMIEEINSGIDQHVATVRELMEMEFISKTDPQSYKNRNHAKVFNFRMIFGGTEWGFYLDIDMPSFTIKKWIRIIKAFWKKYSSLDKFHQDNIKFVYRNGYIEVPTGRWFKFNKGHLKGGEFGYKVNQIRNFPIQGMSGGDILPLLAVIIRRGMRKMGLQSRLILTVHDSIVFDYLEAEKEKLARLCYNVGNNLGTYIQNYYGLDWNVDLEVEVEAGPNYGTLTYQK